MHDTHSRGWWKRFGRYAHRVGLVLATAGVGAAFAWHYGGIHAVNLLTSNMAQIRESESGYRYIKPLLACDSLRDFESTAYVALKSTIEDTVNGIVADGRARSVGVYYRNLSSGQWTSVNGDEVFTGASLLKVPNMMAVFRQEDLGHDTLNKTYTVDPDEVPDVVQDVPPSHVLQDNVTYTVDDLVRYMVAYSDNRANYALEKFGDEKTLAGVYADFDVALGRDAEGEYTLSPRDYSYFFRGLYNATYLSRGLSERALGYLAQVDFNDGLRAGVPAGVTIAHKFGNATVHEADGTTTDEIHDCGIVYGPKSTYFLCVMTKGGDISTLESVVKEISAVVYNDTNR